MARRQYVLCDLCKEDITDIRLRVSNEEADICAKHIMDPRQILTALKLLGVAEDILVSRIDTGDVRYQVDLASVVKGGGGRGITPKVTPRDFDDLKPEFDGEYWKRTSFKIPMTNGIFYVGGAVPKLEPNDVYIDNAIAEEFAAVAVNRYLNG